MMAAEGNNNIVRYTFRGEEGEIIPRHVTHVYVVNVAAVPAHAFEDHPNIEEVICHEGVKKIEEHAFNYCPRLRRVIMHGVKEVEKHVFNRCEALTYIECGKLERIGQWAFCDCKSLRSIDLPSIKIVKGVAFRDCTNLRNAKFGKRLESLGGGVFLKCTSLERITLPLKDDMLTYDNIFRLCDKLKHVDLVWGVHETVAALLMEHWKNDMNEEITAINRILPNKPAGNWNDPGGKARAIRRWISSVLRKIVHYKAEHFRIMDEAAATLQFVLPQDIVRNNVLSFLELPSHMFDGENDGEEEDSDDDAEMDEEE
jgi:hypothetical protein